MTFTTPLARRQWVKLGVTYLRGWLMKSDIFEVSGEIKLVDADGNVTKYYFNGKPPFDRERVTINGKTFADFVNGQPDKFFEV